MTFIIDNIEYDIANNRLYCRGFKNYITCYWKVIAKIDISELFPIVYIKQDYAFSAEYAIRKFIHETTGIPYTLSEYSANIYTHEFRLVKEVN